MPWGRASQVYSPILELDGGDLLAAWSGSRFSRRRWRHEAHGRVWKYLFGVFIVRSGDGGTRGNSDPAEVKPVYGIRPVRRRFDGPLPQRPDILCVIGRIRRQARIDAPGDG